MCAVLSHHVDGGIFHLTFGNISVLSHGKTEEVQASMPHHPPWRIRPKIVDKYARQHATGTILSKSTLSSVHTSLKMRKSTYLVENAAGTYNYKDNIIWTGERNLVLSTYIMRACDGGDGTALCRPASTARCPKFPLPRSVTGTCCTELMLASPLCLGEEGGEGRGA